MRIFCPRRAISQRSCFYIIISFGLQKGILFNLLVDLFILPHIKRLLFNRKILLKFKILQRTFQTTITLQFKHLHTPLKHWKPAHFSNTKPLLFLKSQTFTNKDLHLFRNKHFFRKYQLLIHQTIHQICQICSRPRRSSKKQFKKNQTYTPNITFGCILLLI